MRKLRHPFLCYVHAYDHMKILWIQIQCLVILSSIKFTSSSFWSWPEQYTRYELDAFISHMGPSNHSGHYVCHIRDKQDPSKWVIFNDNKVRTKCWESLLTLSCCQVAESANPPKELGYLYLYKRVWNKRDWAFLFGAVSSERIKLYLMNLLSWRRGRALPFMWNKPVTLNNKTDLKRTVMHCSPMDPLGLNPHTPFSIQVSEIYRHPHRKSLPNAVQG